MKKPVGKQLAFIEFQYRARFTKHQKRSPFHFTPSSPYYTIYSYIHVFPPSHKHIYIHTPAHARMSNYTFYSSFIFQILDTGNKVPIQERFLGAFPRLAPFRGRASKEEDRESNSFRPSKNPLYTPRPSKKASFPFLLFLLAFSCSEEHYRIE